MAKIDKVIVTNVGALKVKYGPALKTIRSALDALIAADAKRGLTTRLMAIDDAKTMAGVKGKAVVGDDQRAAKEAVDAIYKALRPDYLMILGAGDIVPQQTLDNPVPHDPSDPDADPDPSVPSDLPYACEAPFSARARDFRGPSRVVGRLPDLHGVADPACLIGLLRTAAGYQARPQSDYTDYLGITAKVWSKSTALSIQNTFGNAAALQSVPPHNSSWGDALLKRRAHFINCHGGDSDPKFYGQSGEKFPVALRAAFLPKKIADGTVVAAECCYGAQLYDPTGIEHAGICNTYLANGAYGYFGSSTVAYGPSEGNGEADLICQYFLQQILLGASTGRAALEARQKFVQSVAILGPTNLKTLAQFGLMGDPSVQPVLPEKGALTRTKAFKSAMPGPLAERNARAFRRERLERNGLALQETVRSATQKHGRAPGGKAKKALQSAGKESGMVGMKFASFDASGGSARKGAKGMQSVPTRIEMAMGRVDHSLRKHIPDDAAARVILLATVRDGEIMSLRRLHSR